MAIRTLCLRLAPNLTLDQLHRGINGIRALQRSAVEIYENAATRIFDVRGKDLAACEPEGAVAIAMSESCPFAPPLAA